jgi:hypothetical protein
MMKPVRLWPLLVLICGCRADETTDLPPGATRVERLDSGWVAFEWRGHRFLQHSYTKSGGHTYETIHLCHREGGGPPTPETGGRP